MTHIKSRPRLSGKVSTDRLTEGASMSRNERNVSYRTVLTACLSFLNGCKNRYDCNVIKRNCLIVKNLAKVARFKCSAMCTHTCPFRLARLGTSLRIRGKRTTKEKRIHSF